MNSNRRLRQSWCRATIFVAALAAACLAVGGTAHAQVTRTWSTWSNAAWSATGNWAGGVAAGALGTTTNTDTALLSASLTTTQNIDVGTNRNIQSLTIDGGSANTNQWQILNGNLWLTSGGTIQLTGSGGARTDRMVTPLLLLGNNASYTFANNSTLSTRLLSIETPSGTITGQSTTGNTTTIYLAGINTGTNLFMPTAMSGGTNGGGLAIVKQGAGTWSWTSGGGAFVAGSFIPVTINEGRLTGNQVVSAPRSLTLANVAGAEYQALSVQFGGLGSLSGGGPLGGNININGALNLGGLYVGFDNTSTTFGGRAFDGPVVNANGGLNKVGTGTLTLTGSDNNFATESRVQVRQGALRLDFSQSTTGTDILTAKQGIGFAGGNLLLTGSSGGSNSQSFASTTVSAGSRLVLASNGANGLVVSGSAITRSVGGTLDITLPDGSQSATNGVRTTTLHTANNVVTSAASNGIAYATVSGTTWAGLSGASGTVNILPLSSYATGNANYTSANNIDVTDADAPSAFTVNTLRFNGNNTLNLTGANTVATGGVLVTSAAGTGATISSGTLRSGGGTELVFHNYGSQLTIGSTIANSVSGSSNLTLSGTGRYLLNGNMTHTGLTRIMSGLVQLGSSSALGTNPQVDIAADPNATLDLNGFDLTIGALSGAGGVVGVYGQVGNAANASSSLFNMTGGLVNVGSKSLSVGSLNTSTVYNGRIAGSGTFAKVGTSQLAMYSANAFSGFNGTIVVESGTLQAGVFADGVYGYDSFGAASSIVLGKAGSANATLGVGSGSSARPITLATGNSGTLTIAATISGSPVYSGAINGTGNLVFSHAADFFYISGTINNVGTVTFTTVSPNVDNKRYAVSGEIGSNVTDLTLRVTSPSSGANVSTFSGPMKNTGALLIEGQAGALGNVTLSGTISSISSLTLTSLSGTTPRATFSAANTFTAPVSIQSGTLIASNAQALGINSAVTIANSANAALNVNGVNLAIGSLSGVGPGGNLSFANASSRLTTGSTNLNTTYSGSASGAGGFTKVGTGTFTLGGTTTNTGTNFVNQGTLRLASAGAISTAPMNVAESGVLDLAVSVATTGTVTMSGSAASILGLGTLTAPGYAFTNTSGTSTASVNLLGAGGLAKSGSGIALLSGINTYSGTTSITGGVLSITSTAALPGWNSAGRYTTSAGAALVVGNAVTDADFNTIRTTGTFAANSFIGFDTTAGNREYAGTPLANIGTAIGLMKIGTGTLTMNAANTYTGTTSVSGGTLRLETAAALPGTSPIWVQDSGALELRANSTTSGAVTMSGPAASIVGPGSLTAASYTVDNTSGTASASAVLASAGGLTKSNNGSLLLTAANTYQGKTTVSGGVLEFNSIANSGTGNFSALGAPAAGSNATIDLGSGTNAATLRYTGAGHTSNRVINLAGSTGPVTLDASGSGALELTGANTAAAGAKTFTLTGTSTASNSIGVIVGTGVSVNKTGSGLWRLTGVSTYAGGLTVSDGTIVAGNSFSGSGSSFGNGNATVGSMATGISGTAALLVENNAIVDRSVTIAAAGAGSSQVAVLGGWSNGLVEFNGNGSITLSRSVTLQAATGGTVNFAKPWVNNGPATVVTIGSAGNAGTIELEEVLPSTLVGVNIQNGTGKLVGGDDRINPLTPVTIGAAILDINGQSQTLSNLTFAGNSGSITGGTLRLNPSQAVAVAGTGHTISSLVALDAATSFNVNAASRLGISSAISGNFGLTKTGAGILELSGTSGYSGPTLVSGGSLLVNGQLDTSAVTVQSGGLLGGSGTLNGGVTVNAGGTLSPGNSPGLLSVSELVLAGATLMEIDGLAPRGGIGGYDAVDVTGALTYGGSMVIDFGSAITSALADNTEFNLFDFGSYTGLFSSITTANNGSFYAGLTFTGTGNKWTAAQGSQTLEFTHSTGVLVIVPEPGSLALAAIGIAAAAYARANRPKSPRRKPAG